MGVCLGLALEREIPAAEFSTPNHGKSVTLFVNVLDEICRAKGLTPFTSFGLDDEDRIEELEEGETLPTSWFDCAEGLRTVSGIIAALKSEKKWSKKPREWRAFADLMRNLKELERCLEIANKHKTRFFLFCC